MQSLYNLNANNIKDKLDNVSPTFCLAKWQQVTIHLQNGHTHSCHHPPPHYISLEELKKNKYALHNTEYKIDQRKQMIEGKQPSECSYCWNIENLGKGYLSDRHFKSGEYWASESFDDVVKNPLATDVLPTYVEVAFSNVCNFTCMYCSPQVSSKWVEEINQHGPYDLGDFKYSDLGYLKSKNLIPIPERQDNPYVETFWELWPDLYKRLKVFRITGGEPLLSKHTWRVLEFVQNNPNPDLEILINTNLNVNDKFIDKLILIANDLLNNKKVKRFEIFTSIESYGKQAEYIRHGLDFNKFINNLIKVTTQIPMIPWVSKVVIMATYNLLSIPNFRKLLEWLIDYRQTYGQDDWKNIWIDISYLRYPTWQAINIVDDSLLAIMHSDLQFMKDNSKEYKGFQDTEIEKFERAYEYAKNFAGDKSLDRTRFVNFFNEYDKRKGTNLLETFPELRNFYNAC